MILERRPISVFKRNKSKTIQIFIEYHSTEEEYSCIVRAKKKKKKKKNQQQPTTTNKKKNLHYF